MMNQTGEKRAGSHLEVCSIIVLVLSGEVLGQFENNGPSLEQMGGMMAGAAHLTPSDETGCMTAFSANCSDLRIVPRGCFW